MCLGPPWLVAPERMLLIVGDCVGLKVGLLVGLGLIVGDCVGLIVGDCVGL